MSTLGRRSHVKHFSQAVSAIKILPGARYTLFCLETSIQIYTKNGRSLFDIISCVDASVSAAIMRDVSD